MNMNMNNGFCCVLFKSNCPVCQKNQNQDLYWAHDQCGGNFVLTNQAMLICQRCGMRDFIFRWKFDCGMHNGRFQFGCLQGFLLALSCLGRLQHPPGNFIIEVTRIIMDHQNEFSQSYQY